MEILVRLDWISITDKMPDENKVSAHPSLQGNDWIECAGKNGYNVGEKHATGVRSYINYTRKDMGRHTVYSSKALDRIMETKNISGTDILIHHINEGHSIARLDLAIDFIGHDLLVADFEDAWQRGLVKTKLRKASIIKSLSGDGDTLYIGSMKKRKNLIRVYDKGAESGTNTNWIRVELQIMGKKATSTALAMSKSEDITTRILEIIKGVVDFPTIAVWNLLMKDQLQAQMASIPKNQGDTERWLMSQVVPALARTIILDFEFWVQFKMAINEKCQAMKTVDDIPFDFV